MYIAKETKNLSEKDFVCSAYLLGPNLSAPGNELRKLCCPQEGHIPQDLF